MFIECSKFMKKKLAPQQFRSSGGGGGGVEGPVTVAIRGSKYQICVMQTPTFSNMPGGARSLTSLKTHTDLQPVSYKKNPDLPLQKISPFQNGEIE